jgi:hypothetical protein
MSDKTQNEDFNTSVEQEKSKNQKHEIKIPKVACEFFLCCDIS